MVLYFIKGLMFVLLALVVQTSIARGDDMFCSDNGSCFGDVDGETVSTRTINGRTFGSIGDRTIDIHEDNRGNVSGFVGDEYVDVYQGGRKRGSNKNNGNIIGFIGKQVISAYEIGSKKIFGSVDDEDFEIDKDDSGNISIY